MSTAREAGARLFWIAIGLSLASWALASLSWPLGLDQGIFAWVGDTILRGGAPYRDAWEIKGPAIHYLYALGQLLSGREPWGVRVLDVVALGAAALAAHQLGARMADRVAGRVAAVLLVALYAIGGHWNAAQPDGFAAFAWLGAAALVARSEPRPRALIGAGLLCAFAALLKPFFGLFAVLLIVDRWLRAGRSSVSWAGAWLAGGFAAGLAGGLALLAARGALGDWVEVQLVFNPSLHPTAYRELSTGAVLGVFGRWLLQPAMALAALAFCVGIALQLRRAGSLSQAAAPGDPPRPAGAASSHADTWLLLGWAALAAALVVVQNQFFPYHFLPLVVVLAVGAGVGLSRALAGPAPIRVLGLMLGLAMLLAAGWQPALQVRAAAAWLGGTESRAAYLDRFGMGSFGFGAMRRIADHVAARTRPDEPILVWGFESGLYYLADRPASTRLGFLYPLIRGGGTELERGYLREFEESWTASPPAYVLRFGQALNPALPEENRAMLRRFGAWLDACYAPDPALGSERLSAWQRAADSAACRSWGKGPRSG